MNVVPKKWMRDEREIRTVPSGEGWAAVIECEVVSPPSSKGRTVYVFLTDDEGESLMRYLRDAAIQRRRKTMPA